MTQKIVPIIMAGGRGTRLWPFSRAAAPKQFIQLVGDRTLFQAALARVSNTAIYEPPIVVTNEDFRFLVAEQARTVNQQLAVIILEPVARNTAAAIAASASVAAELFGDDAIIQVLASDHEIGMDIAYEAAILAARDTAVTGKLVTFGITPTEPATGYGYIEVGELLPCGARSVKRFVEKPTHHRAMEMLSLGGFYWNSGIFMFGVSSLLSEMTVHASAIVEAATEAVSNSVRDLDFIRLDRESFKQSPDISIDYAIMEKTTRAAVIPSSFKWSDLGSWDAVWKVGERDFNGNVAATNTTVLNTRNSLIMTRGVHLAVQGMEDVAVIASEDAVYVGRLQDSQSVGNIVKLLAAAPTTARFAEDHPTAYRSWGGCTMIFSGDQFQVKRMFLTPGRNLPFENRGACSEHWIVVGGTAEVTIGDSCQTLQQDESVFIPVGVSHRVGNAGNTIVEIIVVQTGDENAVRVSDRARAVLLGLPA